MIQVNGSKKICFHTIKHVHYIILKFNDTNLILIAEIDTSGGIRANVFPDTIWWEVNARRSTLVQSLIAVAVISWSATGLVIYFLVHRRLLVAH